MKRVPIKSLVFAVCLATSSGAYAITTFLSVNLLDPTTLNLGNNQTNVAVTSLSFVAGLVPHFTGDASVFDQNGSNFSISALEKGAMTYHQVCSGRGCGTGQTVYGAPWTQGAYGPFTSANSPIRSTSADLFSPGDILDATFNFVIPGGAKASPSPFSFSFLITDYSLVGAHTLVLTDTTKGIVITPVGGNYSLGADSYALRFVGGSGISVNTASPITAVPLPAACSMMIGGLGLLGGMARQRKTKQQ